MKNLTKKLLTLFLIYCIQTTHVFGQGNINLFGTSINLDAHVKCTEFPTGFPVSLGATHLRKCGARELSSANIQSIYSAVVNELNIVTLPKGIPVMAAFFTTEFGSDTLAVIKEKTHGMCFVFYDNFKTTLYYFEKNESGRYDWVQNLTTHITAISDNLYISLHYSHFAPGSFPEKSTVFCFLNESIGKIEPDDSEDLNVLLSRDMKRQTGLYALGMADSSILTGCNTPNAGYENCNEPCSYFVPNASCEFVSNDWGNYVYACEIHLDLCAAGCMDRHIREENIVTGVPIKFKMMRDFRDKFMSKYCEGRKYTGFYYAFSKFAKMNLSMIWKYAAVLPELYTAMENLSDESADKIIVTPSLREKILDILHEHGDVGDAYFKTILNEVENDLEVFTGLKRSEVISMLSPYGSCNGGRDAQPAIISANSYFASAYYNASSGDIRLNYALPGSRVKFELFGAAGELLISQDRPAMQRNVIVETKSYGTGIYVYRISSDSGYVKYGKIVIAK